MAEPNQQTDDNVAKMTKLKTDLDKMKKVAKKLLQQKQAYEARIKKLKQENETSTQNIHDLQSKLDESQQIQLQLENAMDKKNDLISNLEQKITHKDEAATLQNTTSQQILQELNNKCVEYEKQINQIKTEKQTIQDANTKLLQEIQQFEANNAQLKQSMQESVNNRQEIDAVDAERAKKLKSQMNQMTSMMSEIQNNNAVKINELEGKLAVSLRRTEEMTHAHEKQIKEYESSSKLLLNEKETMIRKYDTLKQVLQEEQQRSHSLMELNGALKKNVMKLHCENDELEEHMDEMQQKYMQSMNNTNNNQFGLQSKKIMDLHSKTIGFKESIIGLKNDMKAISMGFQQQLLSSTAQFAEMHKNQVQEKNKYIAEISRLNGIKIKYDEYRMRSEDKRNELTAKIKELTQTNDDWKEFEKQLKTEREEKESLQQLYNTLIRDRKDIEQHLNDVQNEFDAYKSHEKQRIDEYNEKEKEKEKLYDINLAKAVEQNENLKKEIEKINNEMSKKHETELHIINNEKNELLQKFHDLSKTYQQTQNELNIKKNEIEELLCNNQNMQDEIVKIKQDDENDVILKRRQTPKPKSMDFSTEIHKQLKDENMSKQVAIEKLENEINSVNEQYQKAATELQAQIQKYNELQNKCDGLSESISKITEEKQAVSVKLAKYSQNLKTLMQKLKQYKAANIKNEKIKKELQDKNTKLKQEYDEVNLKLTETNNDLAAKNELNDKYNELEIKYNELMARNEENDKNMRELQQEIEVKNGKLNTLTEDHTSSTQKRQILEMEYTEMTKQNEGFKERVLELTNDIKTAEKKHSQVKDKLKNKYKAYITKQKQNINASTQKLETLQNIQQEHTDLQQKHNQLTKEYESKAIMANEYETEAVQKYQTLKTEYETANNQKNEIQTRYQTLSNEYQVIKSDLEHVNTEKISMEQKINEMEKSHKDAFAKYKEKAKNVINKHKTNAEKQVNEIKQKLEVISTEKNNITEKYTQLLTQNEQISNDFSSMKQENESIKQKLTTLNSDLSQQQDTKNVFEQSISDLNAKLRVNQNDLDTLSTQIISLKVTNNDLENKIKGQIEGEKSLKTEIESLTVMSNKREQTLHKISLSLGECSFFAANDSMSIVEGVNTLAQNYEEISIKHSETKSTASDHELKLKEQADKIKRLAVTVRKLQALRTKLQTSLETTKVKLNQTIKKSEQYHKSLQTIHCEIQRSLEKWKVFINNINNDGDKNNSPSTSVVVGDKDKDANTSINETDEEYLKRCLADVRSLSMYFIQSLDMFREKNEQHQGDTSELELNLKSAKAEIENYKKELEDSRKHIESTDNSQMAKNAHIEKLTEKLNHSIECIKQNWHHDVTKADFVDLAVSTRLVLEDKIWCLIRWRHKLLDIPTPWPSQTKDNETKENTQNNDNNVNQSIPKKKKYNDEYFWSSQAIYLKKLNVKENEIYLPDFFENKLENQITKSLEAKWKAIQRRTDRQMQELKSQKLEEESNKEKAEEQFKQYKAKAKVILQKQKDELNSANVLIKELESYRDETIKLKRELSSLSTENWAEKYKEIEKNLSKQKTDLQNKKLELAEIQSKLLLKERELTIINQEFEKEKDEIRLEFESEKINSKKKYAKKLDDYRMRAREMLQEKDKQLSIARARLKNARNGSVSPRSPLSPVTLADTAGNNIEWILKYDKETQTDNINLYTQTSTQYEYDNYAYDNDEQKYHDQQDDNDNEENNNMITSTDDLIAALQPPLNATIPNKDKEEEEEEDIISTSNITQMARMQASRDQKVREIQERLRRLQELLRGSEEEHKRKDSELNYLKSKFEQIEQAKDVKKSADNSEYLKNALLQYFDGKIDINQLVSVVAVGLRFNQEEHKKAQNSKLIIDNQAGISGYVKSWWG